MSLGLPQFGTHRRDGASGRAERIARGLGFAVLAWVIVVAATEGRAGWLANRSLENSRQQMEAASAAADRTAALLRKHPDALVATASVDSSPDRVFRDLVSVLPPGVSLASLKVDYLADASARLDMSVVAASPSAYDRFLSNLSKSPSFAAIKPGVESRPGLVRASVSAVHRPSGANR